MSLAGNNTAAILQTQLQRARADHSPQITQLQNTVDADGSAKCPVLNALIDDPFANQCNTVQQSSNLAPTLGGKNTVQMRQDYRQFQAASNCCAPSSGKQAQGSITPVVGPTRGGLDHRFIQSSSGLASQTSNQVERQTQRRTSIGAAGMPAEQHGPVRKGTGSQTGNGLDKATQTQDSRQVSTPATGAVLTDIVSDQCASQGNCTGTQHVDSNGHIQDNHQSGTSITIAVTCAGNECGSTTGPPPITIAGGTWNDSDGESGSTIIGTAFLFNPSPGGDALNSLTITGPSGWNGNDSVVLSSPFYHPPGMGPGLAMFWDTIDPVSGTYQASGVGSSNHTGTTAIVTESTLPTPDITEFGPSYSEEPGGDTVSVDWTDPVGAQSYLVRVSPNPFDNSITGEQVVPSGTTSLTLEGLDLAPGQEYQVTVFAFSSDIYTGTFSSPFNMSSYDDFFTVPGD